MLGLSVRGLLQAGHLLQDLVASLAGNKYMWEAEQVDNAVLLQNNSALRITQRSRCQQRSSQHRALDQMPAVWSQ